MDRNTVIVSGRVAEIEKNKIGKTEIAIATKDGKMSFPRFIVKEGAGNPEPQVSDHVNVTGHIEGKIAFRHNGTEYLSQKLIADKVNYQKTLLEHEYGIRGIFFPESDNKAFISGTVEKAETKDGWMHYTVSCVTENRKDLIVLFWRRKEWKPEFSPGDRICSVCKIATSDNKQKLFQDLIIMDMGILQDDYP